PNGCTAGNYPFTFTANTGTVSHTINLSFDFNPLPSPWLETDINTQSAGHSHYVSGVFSIVGYGGGAVFDTDDFHFAYQSLTGDGSIVARVASLYDTPSSQTGANAFGGVMIREVLTGTSTTMYMRLNSLSGAEMQARTTSGGNLVTT